MKTEDNSLLVAVVVEFGVEKFPAIEAFQRGWLRVGERERERGEEDVKVFINGIVP